MKISLQLEADSAEEFRAFFATFQAAPALIAKGWTAADPDQKLTKTDIKTAAKTLSINQLLEIVSEKTGPGGIVAVAKSILGPDDMDDMVEEKPEPGKEPEPASPDPDGGHAVPPVAAKPKRGRPAKAKPEETVTVMPATAPAVAASPAAPVQAAPAPSGNGTGAVSRQDLLDVFAEYVQRYGANFGYTDISGLLQKHLGEGVRKASDVAEAQLAQAIAAIKAAIVDNPFNRNRNYA